MSHPTFKQAFSGRWRPMTIAISVVVIAGVAAGLTIGSIAVFRRAPTEVTLLPKDGQREVGLNQPLSLAFSRPVAPVRVEASIRIEPTLEGAVTSSDRRHFSWTPTGPWADLTTYTMTLLPFKDGDGQMIAKRTWKFTTTIVPRVTGLTTESGAVTGDGSELPLASTLKLGFNTAMAAPTVKILVNGQASPLSWSDDARVATLSTQGVPAGALDLGLGTGGTDRAGHPLSVSWSLHLKLVFVVSEHTVALRSPALIQIPNDNYGARDQSGLQAASMVFEYLTEGSIGRMSALFMNAPDVIGPVRSGRLISFKLTRHYRGINYLSGLSSGSFAVLNADPVPTLFDTQGIFYRSRDRLPPNNLYISGGSVKSYQDARVGPYELVTGELPPLAGEDASSATVAEHNSSYAYDPATGTYLKTEDGHLMNDALVNQPLHIRLLVVMHTRESITNIVEDVGGSRGRDFDTESGGIAEFYFQGKKASGRWSSPDRSSPFAFQLDAGQAVALPKGLVWVDVVGG